MSDKKKRKFGYSSDGLKTVFPIKLVEFEEWLRYVVANIPTSEEYQNATIEIVQNFGDDHPRIMIWYERDETDDEYRKRLEYEEADKNKQVDWREKYERTLLVQLKAKYDK